MTTLIRPLQTTTPTEWIVYCLFYFLWGLTMNWIGQELEIAKFVHWWQVITTYILYMVPISIILKPYPFHTQYAYGLIAMGLLEFGGYALQTSYIYPDNILDKWFGPHVFALLMTLFFAWYFPIGNYVVHRIILPLIGKKNKK